MKTLLLFFSDEGVSERSAIVPTLCRLAERNGVDFEIYICTTPVGHGGRMLPFNGHMHMQQFLYLANFYDKIVYCAMTSYGGYQFRREALAFGGDVVSCRKTGELAEFYREVFAYFGSAVPSRAVILPRDTEKLSLAPYCYPDVLFADALGVTEEAWDAERFAALGVKAVSALYCAPDTGSLPCGVVDTLRPGDTYGAVTLRIAERWADQCGQMGFASPESITRWSGKFCRERILCTYEPTDWAEFIGKLAPYARKVGNDVVIGNQAVVPPADNVCTEFAKYNLVINLIGVNPRMGFTLQAKYPLPVDWLSDARAPWEEEYSDEYLLQKIHERAIPVCFLFYAADQGHLPVMNRILDLMGIEGMRAGIAFPSTWYDYQPELLEQLYIPREQGGVFPQLEPMLASGGISVVTESKGFLEPDKLTDLLMRAKRNIAAHVGERLVPIGYYPYQDADPRYFEKGEPQFDAVAKAGFDYYITYKDMREKAKIVAQVGDMTVLNEQTQKWFPFFPEGPEIEKNQSRGFLMEWEKSIGPDESEWIVLAYDSPFFGLSPTYMSYNFETYPDMFGGDGPFDGWEPQMRRFGIQTVMEVMQYVRRGGGHSGRLFMLKPHELARYARLLRREGLK